MSNSVDITWFDDYNLCIEINGKTLKLFGNSTVLLAPTVEYWEDEYWDGDPLEDITYNLVLLDERKNDYRIIPFTDRPISLWKEFFQKLVDGKFKFEDILRMVI